MSFKSFLGEGEKASAPKVEANILDLPGVYAAAHAKFDDSRRIKQLIAGITGKEPDKLHCTIIYSRQHVATEKVSPILSSWDPKKAEKVRALEVRSFNNPSANKPGEPPVAALVLVLDAPFMDDLHKACLDMGCSYDYADYHPHVTLLYGVPVAEAAAASKVIQEALNAEPLTVTLSNPYVEALKP
jgi:hypothetical protein